MADVLKMERSAKAAVWRKHHNPAPVVNDIDWNQRYTECTGSDALSLIACASTAGTTILKLIPDVDDYLKWVATGDKRWKRMYFGEHGAANSLMWCPTDGKLLASGSECGLLSIIEYQCQEQQFHFKTSFKVKDGNEITCITWSQDGSFLLVATKPTMEIVVFQKKVADGVVSFMKLGILTYPARNSGTAIQFAIVPKFPNVVISCSSDSSVIRMWVRDETNPVGWRQGQEFTTRSDIVAMSGVSDYVHIIHNADLMSAWIVTTDERSFGRIVYGLEEYFSADSRHAELKYKGTNKYKRSKANTICTMKLPVNEYYIVTTGTQDTLVAFKGAYKTRVRGIQYAMVHQHRDHVHIKGTVKCVKLNPYFHEAHAMHAVHGGDGGFLHFWYMGKEKMCRNRELERVDEDHYYARTVPDFVAYAIPPDDASDDGCHVQSGSIQSDDDTSSNGEDASTGNASSANSSVLPTPPRGKAPSDQSYSPSSSQRRQVVDEESPTYELELSWYQPDLEKTFQEVMKKSHKSWGKKTAVVQKSIVKGKENITSKVVDLQNQLNAIKIEVENSLQSCASKVQDIEEVEEDELGVFAGDLVRRLKQIDEMCNAGNTELGEEEKTFRLEVSKLCRLPMRRKFLK